MALTVPRSAVPFLCGSHHRLKTGKCDAYWSAKHGLVNVSMSDCTLSGEGIVCTVSSAQEEEDEEQEKREMEGGWRREREGEEMLPIYYCRGPVLSIINFSVCDLAYPMLTTSLHFDTCKR